jgi:hypothetical protein
MTPEKRRMLIRLAYHVRDPELRHQVLRRLKTATYSKKFVDWLVGKKFTHPTTRNLVLFNSLPSKAKKELHARWLSTQRPPQSAEETEKIQEGTVTEPHQVDVGDHVRFDLDPDQEWTHGLEGKVTKVTDEAIWVEGLGKHEGTRWSFGYTRLRAQQPRVQKIAPSEGA